MAPKLRTQLDTARLAKRNSYIKISIPGKNIAMEEFLGKHLGGRVETVGTGK
jgi:hypothetical protein